MKAIVLMLLLTVSALAQSPTSPTAACGPQNVTFKAIEADTPLDAAVPKDGKAIVYFIQDDGQRGDDQHYTVKMGLDGTWVGAYRDNAVFAIYVDPGEHHVCANVQSKFSLVGQLYSFAHFTAEAGKVYYIRSRFLGVIGHTSTSINLDQPDSDEAKYLIATYPASISKPSDNSKPGPTPKAKR